MGVREIDGAILKDSRPTITRARGAVMAAALVVVLQLLGARAAWAQSDDQLTVAKVKASYLFNFAKYTQWPEASFPDAASPIVVTIVGEGPVADILPALVSGRRVHDRPVEVRRVSLGDADDAALSQDVEQRLHASHMVYVTFRARRRSRELIASLENKAVLTVGEGRSFCTRGGMLGFAREGDHVVFHGNAAALDRAGIEVSAEVLRLARLVEEPEGSG